MNITLSHFLSNITIRIHNNPLITMYTIRAFIYGMSKDYVFLKISSFTNSVLIRSNTSNRRKSRVINWLHYLLNSLSDEEILPGFILTNSFKQTIANIVQKDSIVFIHIINFENVVYYSCDYYFVVIFINKLSWHYW